MRKYYIKLLHFLSGTLFIVSCGNNKQEPASGKETPGSMEKTTTAAKVTSSHISMLHSDFYIIPPPGFTVNEATGQLKSSSNVDYPANFVPMTIYSGITAIKYTGDMKIESEKNSPGVWKEESLTVSGEPAVICHYQVMEGLRAYHLYFTDKWKDKMLVANYDEKDEATGKEMFEALKTVVMENDDK